MLFEDGQPTMMQNDLSPTPGDFPSMSKAQGRKFGGGRIPSFP